MFFKEDAVQDFINYKLNNPQALEEEMRLIKDRQDCTRKLNQYSKQMQNLKNEYNMYKELLDASLAKKQYLQQTYEESKEELDNKIAQCKDVIEMTNREIKQRENKNELSSKRYNDFQKEIALKKDKLTEYHLTQLSSLSNQSEDLKKNIDFKKGKRIILEDELKGLRDRQNIIQQTIENSQKVKNKWVLKKKQLQKLREDETRKEKQIRDQISYAISMEKVIYGNFYKRCAQITAEMRNGLQTLFDITSLTIEGSNLEQKLDKLLQQQKLRKQQLMAYIAEKREKYKINTALPQADALVYNNIVETKINPQLLSAINPSEYRNNDLILTEIEDGLQEMFDKLEKQKKESLERERMKENQINQLKNRIQGLQLQIQTKMKQILSPSRRSKKN